MSELEEVLKEVARKALGLPAETVPSLSSLKKVLRSSALISLAKQYVKHPTQETATTKVESKSPSVEPTKGPAKPAADDQDLLRRLQECEKKFQKKANETEKLRAKLQKEQKARQEAESVRGRIEQGAALSRKNLAQAVEDKERLSAELKKAQEGYARLKKDKEALEEQAKGYEKRLNELEARVRELESIAAQKKLLEAQLARLHSFEEVLPEPFPREALFQVLVLDYPSFAGKAEERVMALIEGYQAFLKGEDHSALRHSNRDLLEGEAEGIVLVGMEQLLLDLAYLPFARWLRTHAFRLEALLQKGQQFSSPHLMEE